ncbi:hypothetical protein A3E41_05225 [Candidatus Woesebacteria bacterium RIFCSPHIGHO2_12_FULL_38_9]|nr:MAG: hypothetical protein A3E41_05225 [Candidatus Woesebacteria bacterium RIFCSPHIGHO2_12_FULL_38_9]
MIKFIYFDVGGVVIRDFSGTNKWSVLKNVIGVNKENNKEFDLLYDKYEKEELCLTRNVDTLVPIFSKKFGINFPPEFSMLEYFINNFDNNRSLWPILRRIKKTYRIGLLTNMYIGMFDDIKNKGLLPPVEWEITIDSTKVGLQKPDPKIFDLAQKQSGVNNSEILFVDNNQKNIDAAEKFGWQTFYYDSSNHEVSCKKLSDLFAKSKPDINQ